MDESKENQNPKEAEIAALSSPHIVDMAIAQANLTSPTEKTSDSEIPAANNTPPFTFEPPAYSFVAQVNQFSDPSNYPVPTSPHLYPQKAYSNNGEMSSYSNQFPTAYPRTPPIELETFGSALEETHNMDFESQEDFLLPENEPIYESILLRDYHLNINHVFSESWKLFKHNSWKYILFGLILLTLYLIEALTKARGYLSPFSVFLHYGIFIATLQKLRTLSPLRMLDFFRAFLFFIPLLIQLISMAILIALGFVCFILPGFYLAISLSFAPYIFMEYHDCGITIFQAMRLSVKQTHKHFWKIFYFMIVFFLIYISGVILLCVGLAFTMPLACIMFTIVFREMFGISRNKVHHNRLVLY